MVSTVGDFILVLEMSMCRLGRTMATGLEWGCGVTVATKGVSTVGGRAGPMNLVGRCSIGGEDIGGARAISSSLVS